MTNVMKNPKYSTVLGLLKEASKNTEGESLESVTKAPSDLITRFGESIRSVFRELF